MPGKSKNKNSAAQKLIMCFLISIPIAFGLIKFIECKNQVLFWAYMGIGGISSLIFRLNGNTDDKSRFLKIVEYIALTCGITLFYWVIWNYFFGK